jgi:hypothetical protein
MIVSNFIARCPYEVGDRVILKHDKDHITTITDILCVHSLKTEETSFVYELDNSGEYHRIKSSWAEKD